MYGIINPALLSSRWDVSYQCLFLGGSMSTIGLIVAIPLILDTVIAMQKITQSNMANLLAGDSGTKLKIRLEKITANLIYCKSILPQKKLMT